MSFYRIYARWPQVFFAIFCVFVMVASCASCSSWTDSPTDSKAVNGSAAQRNDSDDTGDGQSSSSHDDFTLVGSGQKKADSLNAYIDQILSYPETTDSAREILTRAKANGGVSVSDYERTWTNYRQCLLDKGYKEIILNKYPNGIYEEAAYYADGTPSQIQKFDQDRQLCFKDVGPVNEVFSM